jgi:hypothetical protein
MSSDAYPYPVAISRLSEGETSREPQNRRAIRWLLEQHGGDVIVVTPRRDFHSDSLKRLVAAANVTHLTWRGFSPSRLAGRRVVYAWPNRQLLQDLWGVAATALVVIEWNEDETADWIVDADPVQLLAEGAVVPVAEAAPRTSESLPNGVDGILEYVARMAAGYSSGLKWNEEDKLKADMMNRPDRWEPISVEQVRAKCRELKMRPNDIDTIASFLQRRKEGRRFNVRSSYRDFAFK